MTFLERISDEGYTFFMVCSRFVKSLFPSHVIPLTFFLVTFPILTGMAGSAKANPDVYASLPVDTRVIQYGLGDLDGDSREELAVLFSSRGLTQLALFKARSGHWSRWGNDIGPVAGKNGAAARSVELRDTNGDGKDEIIIYYLTAGDGAMEARIMAVRPGKSNSPQAAVLLEDKVFPPGYPLFGTEDGKPCVTFLKMPSENRGDGHRRVYCWEGDRFDKRVEIPWKTP